MDEDFISPIMYDPFVSPIRKDYVLIEEPPPIDHLRWLVNELHIPQPRNKIPGKNRDKVKAARKAAQITKKNR